MFEWSVRHSLPTARLRGPQENAPRNVLKLVILDDEVRSNEAMRLNKKNPMMARLPIPLAVPVSSVRPSPRKLPVPPRGRQLGCGQRRRRLVVMDAPQEARLPRASSPNSRREERTDGAGLGSRRLNSLSNDVIWRGASLASAVLAPSSQIDLRLRSGAKLTDGVSWKERRVNNERLPLGKTETDEPAKRERSRGNSGPGSD